MATLAIILLLIGMALICIEMFVPGFGACGITGIIALILSAALTIITVPYGVFIVAAELVILALLSYVVFNHIRKYQLYGKLILDETLDVERKEFYDLEVYMGREGVSKTSLRPIGIVDFNGTSIEAFSDGAYIPENTKVKVVSVSNQKLTVKVYHESEN